MSAPEIRRSSRTANDALVRFDNVGLRYGTGPEVLSDVSFALPRGGFHVLTGASGAGKSSLLGLLSLSLRPSRGSVSLFGRETSRLPRAALPAFRRRLGVVFQDFRLVGHLSAFDNVALPLRIAGLGERELAVAVSEMLEWVGFSGHLDRAASRFSGGEQQRIAIARAVVTQPDVLLADEPTGNLDAEQATRIFQLIGALNRQGTTVLVATHDAAMATRVPGATVLRLVRGRLIAGGGGGA